MDELEALIKRLRREWNPPITRPGQRLGLTDQERDALIAVVNEMGAMLVELRSKGLVSTPTIPLTPPPLRP